jgi:2-keto-4-pentenoate hydratase/2-oxohepta-3-ene-1,7-dioic acid hydratase in catechol pathway
LKFARFTTQNDSTIRTAAVNGTELQEISGELLGEWSYTGVTFALDQAKLTAPLRPNQIIGIGLNYVPPGEPLPDPKPAMPTFFFKPVSSVVGPGEDIVIPEDLNEVKFEAEIAVIIGKPVYHVKESQALDYVFGYTVANDVTAPQYFHPNGNWTLSKVFPTFTPLGPFIETEFDPLIAKVSSLHNGVKKQDSPTTLMIETIPSMIAYLSNLMPLSPGDVILSGAPAGADFFRPGDTIDCVVEGIGTLSNTVAGR